MKARKSGLIATMLLSLIACGGGGNTPPAAQDVLVPGPADKYVGIWAAKECIGLPSNDEGFLSARGQFTISKTGPNTLNFKLASEGFKAPNCTGVAEGGRGSVPDETYTLNGTTLIGGVTVDKALFGPDSISAEVRLNLGMFIAGNEFTIVFNGKPGVTSLPTSLDSILVYTKR
jgi:hypothetical protein